MTSFDVATCRFDRKGHKVFKKRRESYLTPFDVSAHIKWCERSCQMVWALTSYGVRSLGKELDGTPLPYEKPPFFFCGNRATGEQKAESSEYSYRSTGVFRGSTASGSRPADICPNGKENQAASFRKNMGIRYGSRLNFSDEELIWRLSSSKFNLHLSFWPFFDLSSVV